MDQDNKFPCEWDFSHHQKQPVEVFYKKDVTKDTLKAFDDFIASDKNVWSNVFSNVKVYIFWKFIQYTIHCDKTQMLKRFPLDKINVIKNAIFFLSRFLARDSFALNSQFLSELRHMVCLCKSVCGIFHFRFRLTFINVYVFVQ